jgi:hypothetical protein
MPRFLAFLALLALACPPARAATITEPALLVPLGYCQLSVTTAVLVSTCSGGIPAGATFAYITPETAAIRWRDDGTAPTTTVGNPVAVGQQLTYGGLLSALQVVAQAGTATVNVSFYRY